jgi:hypothetical protein
MPRARGVPNPANNRSDLPGKVPVMSAPDQQYGKRTAQEQSQKMLPVSAPPAPTPSPAPAAEVAPAGQVPPQPGALPGALPWLHPTQRPNEPVSAGLRSGPGPGPEVMQGVGAIATQRQDEGGSLRNLLGALAARPGASSVVKGLASIAGAQ